MSLPSETFGELHNLHLKIFCPKEIAPFLFTFRLPAAVAVAAQFVRYFQNMVTEKIIITFKTAYQLMQELDLAKKRQSDKGNSDYEIVEEILHHERIELINFDDSKLDQKKLVSLSNVSLLVIFHGFELHIDLH